jgi:RNase P protein component
LPLNNYIFVAKQGSENLSSDQLKENVFYLLKKAKILQEEN